MAQVMAAVSHDPIGTLRQLEEEGFDPELYGSCAPQSKNPERPVRGCSVWDRCPFAKLSLGGFKGNGPKYVAFHAADSAGYRKQDQCTCFHYTRVHLSRQIGGEMARIQGRKGELFRIIGVERSVFELLERQKKPIPETLLRADGSWSTTYRYSTELPASKDSNKTGDVRMKKVIEAEKEIQAFPSIKNRVQDKEMLALEQFERERFEGDDDAAEVEALRAAFDDEEEQAPVAEAAEKGADEGVAEGSRETRGRRPSPRVAGSDGGTP